MSTQLADSPFHGLHESLRMRYIMRIGVWLGFDAKEIIPMPCQLIQPSNPQRRFLTICHPSSSMLPLGPLAFVLRLFCVVPEINCPLCPDAPLDPFELSVLIRGRNVEVVILLLPIYPG